MGLGPCHETKARGNCGPGLVLVCDARGVKGARVAVADAQLAGAGEDHILDLGAVSGRPIRRRDSTATRSERASTRGSCT